LQNPPFIEFVRRQNFFFFAALQKPSWASSLLFLTPECAEGFAVISLQFLPAANPFADNYMAEESAGNLDVGAYSPSR
jgi:hypothetical protein